MDDTYTTGSGRGKYTFQQHMYVTEITGWDVLLGRGSGPNVHEGNIRFRNHVALRKDEYMNTKHRNNKSKIAKEVALWVFSNNGRFVKKLEPEEARDTGLITMQDIERTATNPDYILPTFYELVDDETIMEKSKQSLRQLEKKMHRTSGLASTTSSDFSLGSENPSASWTGEGTGRSSASPPGAEQVQSQTFRRMTAPADLMKNTAGASLNFQQLGDFKEVNVVADPEGNQNAMIANLFSQMSSPFNNVQIQQQLFSDDNEASAGRRMTVSTPNEIASAAFGHGQQNHNTQAQQIGYDYQSNVDSNYQSNKLCDPITTMSSGQTPLTGFSNQQGQLSVNGIFPSSNEHWIGGSSNGDQFNNGNNIYSSNEFTDQSSRLHLNSMQNQHENVSQNGTSFGQEPRFQNQSHLPVDQQQTQQLQQPTQQLQQQTQQFQQQAQQFQQQTQQFQQQGKNTPISDSDMIAYVQNLARLQLASQAQNTQQQQQLQPLMQGNAHEISGGMISFFPDVHNQKTQNQVPQTIQSMNANYSHHLQNFGDPKLRDIQSQNPQLTSDASGGRSSDELRREYISMQGSTNQQQGMPEVADSRQVTQLSTQEEQDDMLAAYLRRMNSLAMQQLGQTQIPNTNKVLNATGQPEVNDSSEFQDSYKEQLAYVQGFDFPQQNAQSQQQIPDQQVSQVGIPANLQANQKSAQQKDLVEQSQTSQVGQQQVPLAVVPESDTDSQNDMLANVQGLNPEQIRQMRNAHEYGNDFNPMPFQKRRNSLISGRRGSMTDRRGSMTGANRRGSMSSRRGSMTNKPGRRGSMQSVTMEDYSVNNDYLLDDLLETFSYMSTDMNSHRYNQQRDRIEQHRRMSLMTTGETIGTIDQFGQNDDMSFATLESGVFSEGDAYEYLEDRPTRMSMLGMDFRAGGGSGNNLDSSARVQNDEYEYGDQHSGAGIPKYFSYYDGPDADPINRRSNSATESSWHSDVLNLPPLKERITQSPGETGALPDENDSVDSSDSFNELIAEVRKDVDSRILNTSS